MQYLNDEIYKNIISQGYRCYQLEINNTVTHYERKENIFTEKELAKRAFLDENNKRLFPSGRFCIDYASYAVMKDNVDVTIDDVDVLINFDQNVKYKCEAISLLSQFESRTTRCVSCEMYASSAEAVLDHIMKIVKFIYSMKYDGRLLLELQFPSTMCENIDIFVQNLKLKRIGDVSNYYVLREPVSLMYPGIK